MISISKKHLKYIDWPLIATVAALTIIGLFAIAGASRDPNSQELLSFYVRRQLFWIPLGIIAASAVVIVDYRTLHKTSYLIYLGTIIMLLAVFAIGTTIKGAQRWILVGPMRLQPSEFAKIFLIISLARVLERKNQFKSLLSLIPIAVFVLPPILLIQQQPDLGTALVLVVIVFFMLFAAGLKWKHIAYTAGAAVVSFPLAWLFVLKDYQKNRLLVFLNPERDPLGSGYNVIQSRMAIGSGNWDKLADQTLEFSLFGKGLFDVDTLTSLEFIPEQHTDFIFTVIGEGLGFLGALVVVFLFGFLLYRCLRIARQSKDRFGALIVVGLTAMFFFHVMVNIGMTLGLMPVTGLPLPFISYGGSSYLTNSLALGLILNIGMRHKKIMF